MLKTESFDASDINVKFSNRWSDIAEIEAIVYEKDIPIYSPPQGFDVIYIPSSLDQMIVLKNATIFAWDPPEPKECCPITTRRIYIRAKRVEIKKYNGPFRTKK